MKDLELRGNAPYPKITGANDDPMTVAVLRNLYASRNGELSIILQCLYQSVIADKTNEDIAEILEEIAVVEMTHLSMLMHAINEFGGLPKYEDSRGSVFSTQYINYNTKLKDILDHNIQSEKMAIEAYRDAIGKVKNESLKAMFNRIIEDEQKHLEAFKYLRDSVQFLSL